MESESGGAAEASAVRSDVAEAADLLLDASGCRQSVRTADGAAAAARLRCGQEDEVPALLGCPLLQAAR